MTNNCNNLDAFLDDELAPGESARFAAHLAECPNCREAVDEQHWIDGLLRAPAIAQLETPPPALVASCRTSHARRYQHVRLVACGLAAAAALILVAAGWTLKLNRQADGIGGREVATSGVATPEVGEPSPAPLLAGSGDDEAIFVGGPDVIVVPVESRSPDVTIVRVYATIQPVDSYSTAASGSGISPLDGLAWPELSNGG